MREPAGDAGRWLAEARAGSPEALGRALEACRKYLLLVAERELDPALRAKGGASDLVQETFLEAQRDFAQFVGTSEPELLAWLRRMLLNNVGTFTRSYRQTAKRDVAREIQFDGGSEAIDPRDGIDAPSPSASAAAMAREQGEALQAALARLPEDYRRVITLRYVEARTFDEIGQALGRSSEAARKLWSRAMEALRREWEEPP